MSTVHGPSQGGATKRVNEDQDARSVETVGAEVIHVFRLLDSCHVGEEDRLASHYGKQENTVI